MIFTLKPLKSEEIMEALDDWKQSLYVKAGGPRARESPIPVHPAPASRSGLCRGLNQQLG